MYEGNKEHSRLEEKDEMKYHLPEWVGILQDYFRRNYYSSSSKPEAKEKRGQ